MRKKRISQDKHTGNPSENRKNENPDKRYPNSDDANEEMEPPIKEVPITDIPQYEEVTDHKPE